MLLACCMSGLSASKRLEARRACEARPCSLPPAHGPSACIPHAHQQWPDHRAQHTDQLFARNTTMQLHRADGCQRGWAMPIRPWAPGSWTQRCLGPQRSAAGGAAAALARLRCLPRPPWRPRPAAGNGDKLNGRPHKRPAIPYVNDGANQEHFAGLSYGNRNLSCCLGASESHVRSSSRWWSVVSKCLDKLTQH